MEWHAADGSVMSQAEWVEQLGGGTPEVASPESTSSEAKVDEAKVDESKVDEAKVEGDGEATPEASETTEGDGAPQ